MTQRARLYGGSLYDLAAAEKLEKDILEQMKMIRQIFRENPDYINLLQEPSVPLTERIGLIETAFGEQAERYLVNFIKILCERNILGEFSGCCDEFTARFNVDHNITEAIVTSAVRLSEEQLSALKIKLEKVSGKKVSIIQKTDASVVAGLRVEMEGKQLDGTVSGRINQVSRKLKEVIV